MSRSDLVNYCNCVCQSASCVDSAEQDVHAANCPAGSPAFCSSAPCPAASAVTMSRDSSLAAAPSNGGAAAAAYAREREAESEHFITKTELLRVLRITQFAQRYEYEVAMARVLEGERASDIFSDIWDILPDDVKL